MASTNLTLVVLMMAAFLASGFFPPPFPSSSTSVRPHQQPRILSVRPFTSISSRQMALWAAADEEEAKSPDKKNVPPPPSLPEPPKLSDSMKQKLLKEAQSQGADPNASTGNPIIFISIVVAILVIIGGKGFFF